MKRNHIISLLVACAVGLAVASCGSSKSVSGPAASAGYGSYTPAANPQQPDQGDGHIDISGLDPTTAAVLSEADTWKGTPYLYGGNTRDGVDCSGFVVQVFKSSLGIKLPRTSASQAQWCTPITADEMVPGDLVFFNTTKAHNGVSHVGIYIGNGRMIHSSSKRGVIESDLSSSYYTEHYHSSGRVAQFYAMTSADAPSATPAKRQTAEPAPTAAPVPVQEPEQAPPAPSLAQEPESAPMPVPSAADEPELAAADQEQTAEEPLQSTTELHAVAAAPAHKGARQSSAPAQSIDPDDARARVLSALPNAPITPIE